MAHEVSINAVQVTTTFEIEDFVKVVRLYGGSGKVVSAAFRAAVHELVKDVKPTAADIKEARRIRNENLAKRYQKRVTDARYRGETVVDALNEDGRSGRRGRKPVQYHRQKK